MFRTKLISLIGAAVLVVLVVTACAVWLNARPPLTDPPGQALPTDLHGLNTGRQSGSVPSPTPSPSTPGGSSPRPVGTAPPTVTPSVSPSAGADAAAEYQTRELPVGLLGFEVDVTVSNPGRRNWTVVLTMPQDKPVTNRSPGKITMTKQGKVVTIKPVDPDVLAVIFTVRYTDLIALGGVQSCTIDGRPCDNA